MKAISTNTRFESRGGFTLVELLVSIGLLVLIMSIFAQVFSLAAGTVLTQRGIAQNDKKARLLFTILSGSDLSPGDLKNMTCRATPAAQFGKKGLVPFVGVVRDTSSVVTSEVTYNFDNYLASTGDPRKGYLYISENDPNDQTDDVIQFTIAHEQVTEEGKIQPFYYGRTGSFNRTHDNQPDWDDGIYGNDTARSRNAEVCYYLRNGILYRRLMLIREVQPDDGTSNLFSGYSGEFYENFDYSAFYSSSKNSADFEATLDNTNSVALGDSRYRFGFHHIDGLPRESLDTSTQDAFLGHFIGRFTHEETSHPDFNYPQVGANSPNSSGRALTFSSDGVVNEFRNGPRQSEDILMTNVIAFDVKVWDDATTSFVDLGNSDGSSDFRSGRRLNPEYGPNGASRTAGNNVFDTWHPDSEAGETNSGGTPTVEWHEPPYANLIVTRPGNVWAATTNYNAGDIVLPTTTPLHSSLQDVIGYRAVNTGVSGATEPSWSNPTEYRFSETVTGTGTTPIQWEEVLNIKPLLAIQLTVVYRDPGTNQVKQVSIVHSFDDTDRD